MKRIGLPAVFALVAALALSARPGMAQTQPGPAGARTAPAATAPEPLVQSRVRRAKPQARVRPQIRVQPRYPYRRWHSPYPVPYTYEYPGPFAKRQCVNRYVTERRPSGPVVVPRMHCWWVRG